MYPPKWPKVDERRRRERRAGKTDPGRLRAGVWSRGAKTRTGTLPAREARTRPADGRETSGARSPDRLEGMPRGFELTDASRAELRPLETYENVQKYGYPVNSGHFRKYAKIRISGQFWSFPKPNPNCTGLCHFVRVHVLDLVRVTVSPRVRVRVRVRAGKLHLPPKDEACTPNSY